MVRGLQRRNVIEGEFGHLKNEAGEHLKRGNVRAFGIAKNTLLVGFVIAAQNMRVLETFRFGYGVEPADPVGEFEVGPYNDKPSDRVHSSTRRNRPAPSIAEVRHRTTLGWMEALRGDRGPPEHPTLPNRTMSVVSLWATSGFGPGARNHGCRMIGVVSS